MNFQRTKCLICDSENHEPYLQAPNRFNTQETFHLVRCARCGFVYLSPRPVQECMGRYYEDERYHPHQRNGVSRTDRLYRVLRGWNLRNKRRLIERNCAKGSILDVGCGTGEFLTEMRGAGWRVLGIEPASQARDFAKKDGLRVLDRIEKCHDRFDAITLWHVLEHVHEAHDLLHQLCKLLSPQGRIFIAVPNPDSFDAKIYGPHWIAFDAPRHLYHFRPQDMRMFLHTHGLKVIRQSALFLDPWYNSLFSCRLKSEIKGKKIGAYEFITCGAVASYASFNGRFNRSSSSSPIYIARHGDR
ncbi:MAG: class I SAM-dependent methyltransferase [Candidatus Latescibacteria bacterium]|nr:class I SAM-dependent methyltransferase [Candidatus Latescibacterota bacterium]